MPKRDEEVGATPVKRTTKEVPVELGFLPERLQTRVHDIFNTYFGFGFKAVTQEVDKDDAPNFPNQVSTMSSGEVGDELAKATAWYAYTVEKLRYVAVACTVLEKELEHTLNSAMVCASGKNKEQRLAEAKTDPSYVSMVGYHTKLEGVRSMLDSTAKGFDKSITTLSREISRREHNGYGI
jgi:hypothetical protein